MKRFLTSALFAGLIALLPAPEPADAQKLTQCVNEAIESCNEDFPGEDWITVGIRGWCYMIRSGMCYALEPV